MAIKKDLIEAFRKGAGINSRESALCVTALVDWMSETLVSGKSIELRGLGTFEVRQVSEKKYPSAFSSNTVIPSHGRIIFRPAKRLKLALRKDKEKLLGGTSN